jgi:adenylosuccinate lyase
VGTRISDSRQYAHLWGTPELEAIFDERARLQSWLSILSALANAQARVGIIPDESARVIAEYADAQRLDLDLIAQQTRLTSHSTLGLIRALQEVLPGPAREDVYYGATVQDITDTWFALVMREVGELVYRDVRALEAVLLDLAASHRATPMAGRTHGQPGAPITFGYKAACWADELRRHIDRLGEGRGRWLVGELGGAVGVLGFFGSAGLRLRHEFCAELGLGEPAISWLTTRDRIAEFGSLLAMITTTLARIGNEVYELSRPEIGELHEAASTDAVGSITMPHKRNPETSEHLDTLARLARANAAVLVDGMASSHERDGRSWKAEWVALPEVCLLAGTALQTALGLVTGLVVDSGAMAANLARLGECMSSEQLLAGLAAKLGKHRAQQMLHELVVAGNADKLGTAIVASGVATWDEVRSWVVAPATATASVMTDQLVSRSRAARAAEPEAWGLIVNETKDHP